MALILLVGAGLMIRSLAGLWRVNPGFDPHNVLVFDLSFSSTINSPEAVCHTWLQIHDTLNALSGVTAASLAGEVARIAADSLFEIRRRFGRGTTELLQTQAGQVQLVARFHLAGRRWRQYRLRGG